MPPYVGKDNIARPSPLINPSPPVSRSSSSLAMDVDPSPPTEIPSQLGNFKLVTQVKLGYSPTQIVKWQSQETGLKVVWIDVEGESGKSWGNRTARSWPPLCSTGRAARAGLLCIHHRDL